MCKQCCNCYLDFFGDRHFFGIINNWIVTFQVESKYSPTVHRACLICGFSCQNSIFIYSVSADIILQNTLLSRWLLHWSNLFWKGQMSPHLSTNLSSGPFMGRFQWDFTADGLVRADSHSWHFPTVQLWWSLSNTGNYSEALVTTVQPVKTSAKLVSLVIKLFH